MSRRWVLELLIFVSLQLAGASIFSQQPDFTILSHGGPFESIEQRLQKHNVALTKASLLQALHRGDFEVRWLAAYELVHTFGKETLPDVIAALDVEKEPLPRVLIANVLAQAGEVQGFAALKSLCNDSKLSGNWRIEAAQNLLNLHDQSCLNAVAGILLAPEHDENETSTQLSALALFPRFEKPSPEDAHELVVAGAKSLTHSDSLVRSAAARALAGLGDSSAIPYLTQAIASETDKATALEMRNSLERLTAVGH